MMYTIIFSLLLICGFAVSCTGAADLYKCVLVTDPHIQMFHPINQTPPPHKDCLNDGSLTVVRNAFVAITVDVYWAWMVDFTFTFRDKVTGAGFCAVTSNNFVPYVSAGCATGGVMAIVNDTPYALTISISYPAAQFTMVVTHYKSSWWLYYNMEIWMPRDNAVNATGICSTPGCSGYTPGKRSVRSLPPNVNTTTGISNQAAQQICDAYIKNYLRSLSRTPSQRDVHYNGTITSVRDMCVFDVMFAGSAAAEGILQILMIEEATTGVTNWTTVQTTFQKNLNVSLYNMAQVINETAPEAVAILNGTTTQVSNSSVGSTTAAGSTSGSSTVLGSTSARSSAGSTTIGSSPAGSTTAVGSTTGSRMTGSSTSSRTTRPTEIQSKAPAFWSPTIYLLFLSLCGTAWFH